MADAALSLFARTVADACTRLWNDTGEPPDSVQLLFVRAGDGYVPRPCRLRLDPATPFEARLAQAATASQASAAEHPNAVVFSDPTADGAAVVHTVLHDGERLYLMTQTFGAGGRGEPKLAQLELAAAAD